MAYLCRVAQEGIGIGVQTDELKLLEYDTTNQLGQLWVVLDILNVCPHLCSRVPEPHGINISGNNKCAVFLWEYGGIQSVGETVLEHLPQLGRDRQQSGVHLLYLLLHSPAGEATLLHGRAVIECIR